MTTNRTLPPPSAATAPLATIPVVSVEDLRVHFRTREGRLHAVDGVSFEIKAGETLGLVGETGCGKSVTARSLMRLVPMPPGVHAGGKILYRPRELCHTCEGNGCDECAQIGTVPTVCLDCTGNGCASCSGSGAHTLDITALDEKQMLDIRGNRIAMVFQDPNKALNPSLTIRDQIAEVISRHRHTEILKRAGRGTSRHIFAKRFAANNSTLSERILLNLPGLRSIRRSIKTAIDELVVVALEEVQIPKPRTIMNSYPHELSGGMKQRVMIAQALASKPDLLIADEPTTALDVTIQAKILNLISDLQAQRHMAVLYISHDLSLMRRICDRAVVMYAGRMVETKDSEAIFANPQHPYTRGLLAAIPSITHGRGQLAAIKGTVPELVDPEPSCRFHPRCPYAARICKEENPPLSLTGKGAYVACFLFTDPLSVDRPRDAMPIAAPEESWL